MRNIFDQYAQPENRVTHALMTALHEDRALLGSFLRDLLRVKPPTAPGKLIVLEQVFPGEEEPSEDELDRHGIPDGWICDETGWCVFIESKVLARLTRDQIGRHRRTAERRGFENITAVAITARPETAVAGDALLITWPQIYVWLRKHSGVSSWAARAANFLEIAEAKLVDGERSWEGALTTFSGFAFGSDHPYTYLEGKRVLGLALSELRARCDLQKRLGVDPSAPGRSAITGRQGDAVWDFLSLMNGDAEDGFTKNPHLTLGVTSHMIEAMVTVPHAVNTFFRRKLKDIGEEGFRELVEEILQRLKPLLQDCRGAAPWFRGVQRRYPSQRSAPFIDARIDFDLRTVCSEGGVVAQPLWMSAGFNAFARKRGSNYQIQLGVLFPYDRCPELTSPKAVDLVASAWLGCEPLVRLGV